jgi:nucleotide-binding universal stress UspA family protein
MKMKKIIFPTDFSRTGDAALEYAATLAQERGAQLLLVHAQEEPSAYVGGGMYYGIPEPTAEELFSMLRDVHPVNSSVPCEYRLLQGNPAEAVVECASTEQVDLIVLGSTGRTGFSRMLLGSVAEEIVRKSPCPVLVCKHPARKPVPLTS